MAFHIMTEQEFKKAKIKRRLELKGAVDNIWNAINKSTPMLVEREIEDIQESSGYAETCPVCHHFVYDEYCSNCGQHLKWNV